jgi:hypothetical protein
VQVIADRVSVPLHPAQEILHPIRRLHRACGADTVIRRIVGIALSYDHFNGHDERRHDPVPAQAVAFPGIQILQATPTKTLDSA